MYIFYILQENCINMITTRKISFRKNKGLFPKKRVRKDIKYKHPIFKQKKKRCTETLNVFRNNILSCNGSIRQKH